MHLPLVGAVRGHMGMGLRVDLTPMGSNGQGGLGPVMSPWGTWHLGEGGNWLLRSQGDTLKC